MEATTGYLQIGTKNICVLCETPISNFNYDVSDKNLCNSLKTLTNYCDIDPFGLFEMSDGVRQFLKGLMNKNGQLEKVSFNGMCQECMEEVTKLEYNFNKMISAKAELERSIWTTRNRILVGQSRKVIFHQQTTVVDEPAIAGRHWRQQILSKCNLSNENLLRVLPQQSDSSFPIANDSGVEVDNQPRNYVNAASGISSTNVLLRDSNHEEFNDDVTWIVDVEPVAATAALTNSYDVPTPSIRFENESENKQRQESDEEEYDALIDVYEKNQPKDKDYVAIPRTSAMTSNLVVSGLSNMQQPKKRLPTNKKRSKSSLLKRQKRQKLLKASCGLLQCGFCSHISVRASEVANHELLMHPFDKLKDSLPAGTTQEDIQSVRDAYIKECKRKSNTEKSGILQCVHCDEILYPFDRTGINRLKIHLVNDHRNKLEILLQVNKLGVDCTTLLEAN